MQSLISVIEKSEKLKRDFDEKILLSKYFPFCHFSDVKNYLTHLTKFVNLKQYFSKSVHLLKIKSLLGK